MRGIGVTGVLVALTAGSGCWVPKETGVQMQQDIAMLQRDLQDAQKSIDEQRAALSEQMKKAAEQIEAVSKALADLNRAARMTDADFGVQIERLIRETQELRGTLEMAEYRLGKMESNFEGDSSLPQRVATLEAHVKAAPTEPGESGAANTAEASDDPKAMIAKARGLTKDGKIAEARGLYREVIKRWPDKVGVTDEAYFRLGDSYYDERKFRNALPEYIKVAEKFAGGRYVDDALYRIGLCSTEIGNLEDALIFFGEIVKNHRRSPLVKNAKKKIEEVKARLDKEHNAKASRKSRSKH